MWRSLLLVLAGSSCLLGCVAEPQPMVGADTVSLASLAATPSPLHPYPNTGAFQQCVPFARTVSGIDIYGDAWTWWDAAARRFERGNQPRLGAVLVLRRTAQLPTGHVAVIAELGDSRHALVTHANWGADGDTRGVIHERMPITDVSPANDWSQIRLMNRHGQLGRVYVAYGFIYPAHRETITAKR
jgi:hypothetical protein